MTGRNLVEKWNEDNKSFLALNVKNKMLPTIYGLIIGDLIGVPVEFKDRDTYTIKGITGYGTYNQPPGTWSDDTSLTLCLMKNIKEIGDLFTLMNKFARYKSEGYCTPYDEMFDIGRTTLESINRFESGLKPKECGGKKEFDNGNGALMRIAPLTFLLIEEFNFKKKVDIVKSYTEITHAHPRSIVGSIIYIELLLRLYHNNTLLEGLSQIKELFTDIFDEESVYLREFSNYWRIFNEDFLKTSIEDIKSDGYVVHTFG